MAKQWYVLRVQSGKEERVRENLEKRIQLRGMEDVVSRVLVPTEHAEIHVEAGDVQVELRWNDRRWSFPRQDCVLLPMANTTVERLAQYIGRRLAEELADGSSPDEVRVEVQECFGQSATCLIVAD